MYLYRVDVRRTVLVTGNIIRVLIRAVLSLLVAASSAALIHHHRGRQFAVLVSLANATRALTIVARAAIQYLHTAGPGFPRGIRCLGTRVRVLFRRVPSGLQTSHRRRGRHRLVDDRHTRVTAPDSHTGRQGGPGVGPRTVHLHRRQAAGTVVSAHHVQKSI